MNLIRIYGLERKNYFIIGLFCDRTMTLNVVEYFRRHKSITHGLKELYFRHKASGGWPGGVRLVEENGNIIDLPNTERMKVKDYFQPERCLYCLDKLNIFADISLGDNYTGRYSDTQGSSSVIVRTDEGLKVWRELEGSLEVHDSNPEEIFRSQHLKNRQNNYFFAKYKESSTGRIINIINFSLGNNNPDLMNNYKRRLQMIRIGENYINNPSGIIHDLRVKRIKALLKRNIIYRALRKIITVSLSILRRRR